MSINLIKINSNLLYLYHYDIPKSLRKLPKRYHIRLRQQHQCSWNITNSSKREGKCLCEVFRGVSLSLFSKLCTKNALKTPQKPKQRKSTVMELLSVLINLWTKKCQPFIVLLSQHFVLCWDFPCKTDLGSRTRRQSSAKGIYWQLEKN